MGMVVFTYVAFLVCVVGIAYRFYRFYKLPVNIRWEVYPVPHEPGEKKQYGGSYLEDVAWYEKELKKDHVGEWLEPLKEILWLERVKKYNRYGLWIWSFCLHWGLWLMFLFVVLMLINTKIFIPLGLIKTAGILGYGLGSLGVLGLLVKRTIHPTLKLYTSPIDRVNLLLLLALFVTGFLMVVSDEGLKHAFFYFNAILSFAPQETKVKGVVFWHFFIFNIFILYLPFSKFFHGPAKYLTYHKILWDDMPQSKGSKIEKLIEKQLGYQVGWSGPHVKPEKTWLENAQN
ncbi:respiratory nitrate reductase subunit gamma [Thermodesulfobacterium hveragerdense]|uniref:respiratory nitrate reductase subunit gamma n=1 Tax=Thermodesulfobacterium hveragerdense TaxID=53424 RepID=UPI0004285188|nr:respiratory nitrate reductase subunit gamma [Thermodesulfobacterium hveragerdense]